MKEFNYQRAWKEYVKPEFEKLSQQVRALFSMTHTVAGSLVQVDARHQLTGQSPELTVAFDAVPVEELAWASKVIYYFGHLSHGDAQDHGLYWKFQILADTSLLNRGGSEALRRAGLKIDAALKSFDDHKKGTEYEDDEVAEHVAHLLPGIAGVLELVEMRRVNFKPHPFVIGARHFPKCDGMYIDPHAAGCVKCGEPYEKHTSERAMLVRPLVKGKEKITEALKLVIETCKNANIKFDGFVMVEGGSL